MAVEVLDEINVKKIGLIVGPLLSFFSFFFIFFYLFFFFIQLNVPFKIISAHMRRANQ